MADASVNRTRTSGPPVEVYGLGQRIFHWVVVAMILVQVPLAFAMTARSGAKIFDDVTTNMYAAHKFIGVSILAIAALRLLNRLVNGAPDKEPTIPYWQHVVSRLNHWSMYVLLLVVPLLGWIGSSYVNRLDLGIIVLPSLVTPPENEEAAKAASGEIFEWHEAAAFTLIALVALHFAAAMYHWLVRRDNVMTRMWPSLRRRD